jgi:hypothetical protein
MLNYVSKSTVCPRQEAVGRWTLLHKCASTLPLPLGGRWSKSTSHPVATGGAVYLSPGRWMPGDAEASGCLFSKRVSFGLGPTVLL